jgi:hypothetical protein
VTTGTEFTCFTSTKAPLLTPEELRDRGALTLKIDFGLCDMIVAGVATPEVCCAHVCSRMLTYADVCDMIVAGVATPEVCCAHVCSRMLTYADVCDMIVAGVATAEVCCADVC